MAKSRMAFSMRILAMGPGMPIFLVAACQGTSLTRAVLGMASPSQRLHGL